MISYETLLDFQAEFRGEPWYIDAQFGRKNGSACITVFYKNLDEAPAFEGRWSEIYIVCKKVGFWVATEQDTRRC